MKSRLLFFAVISMFIVVPSLTLADEPPNFVIFLADDMGYGDAGCYGHPVIQTPNLDAFAKQGVRLTNCYSADSVCSPSRSAILTGRTPYRNGVWRWIPAAWDPGTDHSKTPREGSEVHLRRSEITIPTLLKKRGYETCHCGKWHLNGFFNMPQHPQPNDHGYDWWFATQNNAHPTHKNPINFVRNGKAVGPLEGFSAHLVADEACEWIANRRDKSKPFFITIWSHEPHLPIESNPKFMDLYKENENPGIRQHHGNITQLDDAFGQVMKTLDDQGLTDNTFVIFTSDNGPEGNGKGRPDRPQSQQNRNWGSTGGLRGRKRDTWEGGIRVPGIVRWPGKIKPGTVSDIPVYGCDIFSTVCDIAGISLPSDHVIDGASIVPLFEGNPIDRIQPMYWRNAFGKMRIAIVDGDWKIIGSNDRTHFELYNLREDRAETSDVSAENTERFERMKRRLIEQDLAVMAEAPDWKEIRAGLLNKMGQSKQNSSQADPILERIEWTDIWVTNANKGDLPRVLFVGDSIARGYFNSVEKELVGKADCARLTTSAFISHDDFLGNLKILLRRYDWDVIHINNGLHGWEYTEQQYRDGFPPLGDLLKEYAGDATIIWALTTPLRESGNLKSVRKDSIDRVRERNRIATEFATKHGYGTSDLFSLSIDNADHHRGDGTHFSGKGIAAQAVYIADVVSNALDSRAKPSSGTGISTNVSVIEYFDDFKTGADDWQFIDSDCWKVAERKSNHVLSLFKKQGSFEPTVRSLYHMALLKDKQIGDFLMDVRILSTEPDYDHRDACVIFGYQSPTRYYYIHLGKKTDGTSHQIQIVNDEDRSAITLTNTEGTPWDDQWHRVRVKRNIQSGEIAVYFDDTETPTMTARDKTFTWGRVGLGSFDDVADFDDFKLVGKTAGPKSDHGSD